MRVNKDYKRLAFAGLRRDADHRRKISAAAILKVIGKKEKLHEEYCSLDEWG